MTVSRDKTEELRLADLMPGPPVPTGTPPTPGGRPAIPSQVPPPTPPAASAEAESQDAPPSAVPAAGPPPVRESAAPAPPRPRTYSTPPSEPGRRVVSQALRQPFRRLWRVYTVVLQVVASYTWFRMRVRLGGEEKRHELEDGVHRANARRIKQAIVDLQGLFIKVGQLISIMANFLPEAFREELEELQDKVPPRPYDEIEARLLKGLGGRQPGEVFAEFEKNPIASASIGQVHRARLHNGEHVAVKIQYPDIEAIVRTDLKALGRIFWVLRWMMPDWGFSTIYREIREMVMAELDYKKEADSMEAIAANFAGRTDVRIPRVFREYSSERVLTSEWMDGFKVADTAALDAASVDRKRIARTFVDAYCKQIFVDGVYHADPHPGNLMVQTQPDGTPVIVFLDFGATASVSEGMRRGMLTFLQGAATRDTGRLVGAMKDMGFISRRADPAVFDRVVEYFHERLHAEVMVEGFSLKNIKFDAEQKLESLLDLRAMNVSLGDLRDAFHVPKDWVMLERALLLLLGVCTTVDPEMNPTVVIKPYLERFLAGEKADLSEAAMDATREAALAALSLPAELRRFLSQAQLGKIEVQSSNLHESARLIYTVMQQMLWGLLGLGATSLAVVFDGRDQPRARGWAIFAACLSGLFLLNSLATGRKQRRRPEHF